MEDVWVQTEVDHAGVTLGIHLLILVLARKVYRFTPLCHQMKLPGWLPQYPGAITSQHWPYGRLQGCNEHKGRLAWTDVPHFALSLCPFR